MTQVNRAEFGGSTGQGRAGMDPGARLGRAAKQAGLGEDPPIASIDDEPGRSHGSPAVLPHPARIEASERLRLR
jgi:hypothetical protein